MGTGHRERMDLLQTLLEGTKAAVQLLVVLESVVMLQA